MVWSPASIVQQTTVRETLTGAELTGGASPAGRLTRSSHRVTPGCVVTPPSGAAKRVNYSMTTEKKQPWVTDVPGACSTAAIPGTCQETTIMR